MARFHLQNSQRHRIQKHFVRAFEKPPQLHQLYVGGLHQDTTEKNLRGQLKDLRVHEVTDIISLKSRNRPNAPASFCIVVDNLNDKMKIDNQDSWPERIRIRDFIPRDSR